MRKSLYPTTTEETPGAEEIGNTATERDQMIYVDIKLRLSHVHGHNMISCMRR